MMAEWDRIDRLRFRGKQIDTLDLWPRDHIKTWLERARILRWYLIWPHFTCTWWHAVEEMAQESAVVIGKTFQQNKEFRRLMPEIMPSTQQKRFVQASGFSLVSNRLGDAPSMRAWGAGSEATGGHSMVGVLDDPVGWNDVQDSQLGNKRRWYQATVRNVVRSDGWVDAIMTRWDRDDLAGLFLKSKNWKCTVRAALETDGKPDIKGTPVYLTTDQVQRKREELGVVMFSFQMMNDATQTEIRPWKSETCEHFCEAKDADGPGFMVVVMDPAAEAVGGEDYLAEKSRGDGSKDSWAIQVWKIRRNGQRQERIWLDGDASDSWTMDEGMAVACRLQRKWGVRHVAIEDYGPRVYESRYREIARKEGVSGTLVQLESTSIGKNARWGAFCGRAESGEILICKDTVPDSEIEKFLDQARNWIPRGKKNSLPFDDRADCASYVMDPVFDEYAPRVQKPVTPFDWAKRDTYNETQYGGRYIRY